jgi:DNA invertase Pin-like site-specific DNA recombinase
MVGAFAEFERDIIADRTQEGLAAARARGRKGGRPVKLTPAKAKAARQMYDSGEQTVGQIARILGVSRATIYRHLDPSVRELGLEVKANLAG